MKCPYCTINFHNNWDNANFYYNGHKLSIGYRIDFCPECKAFTIEIRKNAQSDWTRIAPLTANRGPVSPEVPIDIAQDYVEACIVLALSPKASAALSRRCLQTILRAQGYKARDLSQEIELLLDEADPKKGIPESLRHTIDGIRNFGNFSAHPVTDLTTLQIIDVEPHEAEWCLEIIEEMFQHFYVRPARAAARKAALDAKLSAAGKPPSK